MLLHQRVEVAQVAAEVGRRHGGVLPSRQPWRIESPRGKSRALLANPPEDGLLAAIGDVTMRHRLRCGDHPLGGGRQLGGILAGQLDVEVAVAGRQVRDRAGAVSHPVDLDDAGVEALAGHGPERQHRRHVVGGLGHARVAEHHEVALGGVLHEVDGGAEQHAEGALGAGHERGDVEPVLGEQVLEAVPGHLAAEGAHLGTHRGQAAGDGGPQAFQRRRRRRDVAAQREPLPRRGDDVETGDVVGAAPVAECVVAAGVVADHAADGAARVARRVGPIPQAVRRGRALQRRCARHRGRPSPCGRRRRRRGRG